MAKVYYTLDNIDKTNADYRVIIGEKGNGKSYAVKSRLIDDAYNHNKLFVYMRRRKEDLSATDIASYFGDAPVDKITHGLFTKIVVDRSYIYVANYDEVEDKFIKGPQIGRAVDLNRYDHFASQTFFPECKSLNIIYEEFLTTRMYLSDEPNLLQKMVSTILRERLGNVYLIGNTVDRTCPFFTEWFDLRKVWKMKPGDIAIYDYHRVGPEGEDIITKIALELCPTSNSSSNMYFGQVSNFITGGKWETYEKPHLPKPADEYTVLYELLLEFNGVEFVMQLLIEEETGGQFVYLYPFTGKRNIYRKITNKFSTNPLHTYYLNGKIKAEEKIKELIKLGKVCYSDNQTGTDFEQILLQRKGNL